MPKISFAVFVGSENTHDNSFVACTTSKRMPMVSQLRLLPTLLLKFSFGSMFSLLCPVRGQDVVRIFVSDLQSAAHLRGKGVHCETDDAGFGYVEVESKKAFGRDEFAFEIFPHLLFQVMA